MSGRFFYLIVKVVFINLATSHALSQLKYEAKVEVGEKKVDIKCNISSSTESLPRSFIFDHTISIDSLFVDGSCVATNLKLESDTFYVKWANTQSISLKYRLNLCISEGGTIFINRTSKWIPFQFDEVSSLNMEVKTPKNFMALSAGICNETSLGSVNSVSFINDNNTHFPLVLIGHNEYNQETITKDGCTFRFYIHRQHKELSEKLKAEVTNTYVWMKQYMGNGFDNDLTVVSAEGLEYVQSLNRFMVVGHDYIQYLNYPELSFWPSHEVIHQWIGSGYHVDLKNRSQGRWFLEESLTEYLRFVYLEDKFGKDTLNVLLTSCLDEYDQKIRGSKIDNPLMVAGPDRMVYAVAPLFFHYLRHVMGEQPWRAFLANLYLKHCGAFIDANMFFDNLHKYLDGNDLCEFAGWLAQRGIPDKIRVLVNGCIVGENLSQHLLLQTSAKFKGRGIDNGGAELAAGYISNCFKQYGLECLRTDHNDSGYFQHFVVNDYGPIKDQSFVDVDGEKFYSGKDFVSLGFGGINPNSILNGRRSFMIIKKDELSCALSSGKTRGEIRLSNNNKQFLSACGALDEYDLFVKNNPLLAIKPDDDSLTFKMVASAALSKALIKHASKTGDSVVVNVCRDVKPLNCKNVIGYFPAKVATDSTILITAHYDHLGETDGTFYPGANDNASGVAVLLELARLVSEKQKDGWRPGVNIVFIAFSAEEGGLLGSSFFVDNPTVALPAVKYVLNLDMVGGVGKAFEKHPETLYLYQSNGVGHDVVGFLVDGAEDLPNVSFNLNGNPKYLNASDQASFMRKGVPSLFVFSGIDKNCHKSSDTIEFLSLDKMVELTLLLKGLLVR